VRFGHGQPFAVGIEEELLVVDAGTHRLARLSDAALARVEAPHGAASRELYAAQIELRSPPCSDAAQAAAHIGALRNAVTAAGITTVGAGVHPAGALGDSPHSAGPRFDEVGETLRGLARLTPDAALHVHIAMPDPDTAVRVANGLREHLPLLAALAANSPYWFGVDAGCASARAMLTRAHPRRGIPPRFRDFEHYEETTAAVLEAADAHGPSFVWWDVRLRPDLGTVEVREMDSQSSLVTIAGLAALVQGLALETAQAATAPATPRDAIIESSFRAIRDGVRATILHAGTLRPVAEVARGALTRASPHVGHDALEPIERILSDGGGADRRRAAFARGKMAEVLAELVRETRYGSANASSPSRR
jgi:glutamate---cysteine ligase / carboxylate-amine ligase